MHRNRNGVARPMASAFSVLLCFFFFQTGVIPSMAQSSSVSEDFLVEKDVAVPMRDGVVLRADVLLPRGEGRFPVLVYRTPYGKEVALKDYTTFGHAVERGYAVVVQDVRGRFASAGEFRPYENEGRDGYDTIEWAARQPWSDGNVGTFGLSYPGAVQWLAAVESPPHLKAMAPAMTFSTPQNFFYAGGVWDLSWIEWIWENIAPDVREKKNLPGPKIYADAEASWGSVASGMLETLPLGQLKELRGIAPYYYDWLSHPPDDPWWQWCELRDKYDRVHAAVLNLSGWYDDNYGPEGATTNFLGLLKSRAGEADPRTHLLIGPWVHGVESTARTKSGEREFGPAAAIDYDEVILRWMDYYLRGIKNGVAEEKPVRYFVMGADKWREADSWPRESPQTSYYLTRANGATSGLLSDAAPGAEKQVIAFVSDPAQPVTNKYDSPGAHDYRHLQKREDVLTFDSPTLQQDLEVTGNIHAQIYVSCDCRDLDLWVRLLDVGPDGTAFNLMSPGLDVLRASYRALRKGHQLLVPGHVYELNLENLITSNVFKKGHRIEVQISGSFFPNFSRNLQSGELEMQSSKIQKARITIYADKTNSSRIILPVATH
ncbi:MAG TPA: CocE/NonD family hydrolase [Terriglobales bacterium]|nr:CocE/NonD family hydrolase [Terriglobales bacterium]